MTQLAAALKAWRADEAALYVRQKVAERGWTEEIEAMAMLYVYDDDGVPRYPVDMSEIFGEFLRLQQVPLVRDWYSPAARRWTRFMYGRRGWFFAFGWLFWLWFAWLGVKVLLYFGVLAVMLALFVLTAGFDLATYPVRKR